MSASAKVVPIPVAMIPAFWPLALPHLERGAVVAELDPQRLLFDLARGHAVLWCVFYRDQITAAFFSSVHEDDDGANFLMVYGLGGKGVRNWISTLVDTLEAHAKVNNCTLGRFHGAPGWQRLIPTYRATSSSNGAALYERAFQ